MEEHIPHLSSLLVGSAEELTVGTDVIVVGYQSPEFSSALQAMRADQTVIDLARLAKQVTTPAHYEGICW
jgi:GDP-mannose 6-dehydrogenase